MSIFTSWSEKRGQCSPSFAYESLQDREVDTARDRSFPPRNSVASFRIAGFERSDGSITRHVGYTLWPAITL